MFLLLILLVLCFGTLQADEKVLSDSHGPISIMGDHIHKKREFMFSYRLMKMEMNNILNGTKKININRVMTFPNGASDNSGSYMNSPKKMSMEMHMFGMMFAPSNNLTLMLMTSFNNKEMIQQRMPMSGGANFGVNSSGIGDTRLSSLIKIVDSTTWKNHFGLGMSFPTGSINERDVTPVSESSRLGYGMQQGSGTFDTFFLFNNVNKIKKFTIGEQIFMKVPSSGKNKNNYRYGNSLDLKFWFSYRFVDYLSTSVKINYKYMSQMKGSDNEMNKRMSPVLDSYNTGYQKINLGLGINFVNNLPIFKNHRLAFEILLPVYQNLRGIQMSENYSLIFGWQYGF